MRRAGYKNIAEGLRRLDELLAGDLDKTRGLIRALPAALDVPPFPADSRLARLTHRDSRQRLPQRFTQRDRAEKPAGEPCRFVLRVDARVQARLGHLLNFGANLDIHLAQPIRNMPRPGDPRDRKGFCEPPEQWTPARRHLAVSVDLHRPQHGFRVGDALADSTSSIGRFIDGGAVIAISSRGVRLPTGRAASGKPRPASPADFDDHVLALSREANIPVHFVHGISAVTERDGQTTAALAETIVKGISQERVRRLFALLQVSSPALRDLPPGWMRILPADAPLTAVERWEQTFARSVPADWPDGIDRSAAVLEVLRLLAKGSQAADEIGEKLLSGVPLTLWRRALDDGPAEALPVTLTRQHVDDELEPASNVIWASAVTLASSPRAHVRLLALNAGRWPRHISEDRLIPDHVLPIDELDPLPVADGDKRDFATIIAMAKSATHHLQAASDNANRRQCSRYAASCKPSSSTTLAHNQDGASREAL